MLIPNLVLTPDQREVPLNVLGTHVTILASKAATLSDGITHEISAGPPAIPRVLAVLEQHGVTIAA